MSPRPANADDFPIPALLDWYREHQRELPFRPRRRPRKKNNGKAGWAIKPNPYHVLVSEAMAQQTQIATVVPYFHRFVEAFPTVHDLADADEQRVLTLWQGLGYYRRARNLHAAAKMIVDDFDGKVPPTADELLQLPGVGRYTAGAVASVAYNTPAPIVDGNVARVFARYFLIEDAVDKPATLKELWRLAEALVKSTDHPRDLNQSIMELGALVCTPKSAKCLYCPLNESCAAQAAGRVTELPVKTPKKKPVAVTHTILAIHRAGKYLFEQRPATGLWSNMWQMPTLEDADATTAVDFIQKHFGLVVKPPQPINTFTHQTTHRTIKFDLVRCEVASGRLRPKRGAWRKPSDLQDLPLAKPQLTAVDLI
ncbi:MAG: A/G-specific adenine glycosylase [Planctomycetota bacterium]